MNLKTALIASLVATAASASFAQGSAANTQFGELSPVVTFETGSTLSREQVRQATLAAQAAGEISFGELQHADARVASSRSREDVKAEVFAARAAGELPAIGEGVSTLKLKARQSAKARTNVAAN